MMGVMRWPFVASILALFGCGGYQDTYTLTGIPNFHVFLPPQGPKAGMYRTGLPPTPAAWDELRRLVAEPGRRVTKIVLHDTAEGDESPAEAFGWRVVWIPLPPEEDQPLSVLRKPLREDVERAVSTALEAHASGDVVVWGCKHDRDRGGLVSALIGRRLFGWSKEQAWKYALATGLRWELPDLDAYWLEDVP
jgi:hypothetical protein